MPLTADEQRNVDDEVVIPSGVPESGISEIDLASEIIENQHQDNARISRKIRRARIIINDYFESNPAFMKVFDVDDSDDDFEDDKPCGMNELILPNANTDRNAVEKLTSNCSQCPFQAVKGWKQLTKHYIRKHPGEEISISRLAKTYNPRELINPIRPVITNGVCGIIMIQSMCYICNEQYNMCSSRWLMHFIAHTGNEKDSNSRLGQHH